MAVGELTHNEDKFAEWRYTHYAMRASPKLVMSSDGIRDVVEEPHKHPEGVRKKGGTASCTTPSALKAGIPK